jgi:hypothetical protein
MIHKITYETKTTGECERGCCASDETTFTCQCGWTDTIYEFPGYKEQKRVRLEHERELILAALGIEVTVA